MHSRRARPTLRLIVEDLTVGWESPQPLRLLAGGTYDALHPLSELPHPIITKAAGSFGLDAANANYVGSIAGSAKLRLLEIKIAQAQPLRAPPASRRERNRGKCSSGPLRRLLRAHARPRSASALPDLPGAVRRAAQV